MLMLWHVKVETYGFEQSHIAQHTKCLVTWKKTGFLAGNGKAVELIASEAAGRAMEDLV